MKRLLAAGGFLLMFSALLFAGGQQENEESEALELHVAADATALSGPMFEALFSGFEKAFPDVRLTTEVAADMGQILSPRIAAGNAPDAMYGGIQNQAQFMSEGLFMELSEFYESKAYDADMTVAESLISGAASAIEFEGGKYGVPVGPGFTGLIVNETMFEEYGWQVPRSWEELLAVSKEIRAAGIVPVAYGAAGSENRLEHGFMTSTMYEVGGEDYIIDLDNMVPGVWGSRQTVEALGMLEELVEQGVIDRRGLGMDPPQSQIAFLQGQYAMCVSGFWFEMEMVDQIGDLKLGYIAFPTNRDGRTEQSVNAWFNTFTAWNTDEPERKEAVWNFLKYLVGYEFQKTLATDGGLTVVANRRVMAEMADDPNTSHFNRAVAATLADPDVTAVQQKYMAWYTQTFRVPDYIDILRRIVAGDATPEEGAQAAEQLAERLRNDETIIRRYR